MFLASFESEVNSILDKANDHARQKYLNAKIDIPKPSFLKIGLLFIYLNSQMVPLNKIRSICMATALVQMGLDIHEWVTNEHSLSTQNMETRQLQVLAGDYYSAQYFSLLASNGAIEEIKQLSMAIRKNNQQRVLLYQLKLNTSNYTEKWLTLKTEIESSLIKGFVDNSDLIWKNLIDQFIRLELLLFSKEISDRSPDYVFRWGHDTIIRIQNLIRDLNHIESSQVLKRMLRPYEQCIITNLVAEEI